MKKIFIIFIFLFSVNAYALYTQNISNACGIIQPKLRAAFEPNEHICQSGYFLPANTDGCRPCPIDHVCGGGTFKFNERQSQGIIYKTLTRNATNACASNISHKFVATFEPVTVLLHYDNGDGTSQNDTCVYDNLITLPTAPTRTGYTFSGWKLQPQNNKE